MRYEEREEGGKYKEREEGMKWDAGGRDEEREGGLCSEKHPTLHIKKKLIPECFIMDII